MTRDELIAKLKATEPLMRQFGIDGLFLFGSQASQTATDDSDVDIFIDKADPAKFGFDQLMGGYHAVVDALPGMKISYGTRAGLDNQIRDEVEKSAIRIF